MKSLISVSAFQLVEGQMECLKGEIDKETGRLAITKVVWSESNRKSEIKDSFGAFAAIFVTFQGLARGKFATIKHSS